MDKPALCLSVLNGQVTAAAVRKGALAARWESPKNWDDASDLAGLLGEVIAQTQPDGRQVAMVLCHPRLSDQLLEVPPVKGSTLLRLLERHAETSKAFAGTAAWSDQAALPTKKSNAVLLHLCPKTIVDQLVKGCEQARLQLVRLLPTTAVLIGQLKALPLEKDDVALLVAETGSSTTLVIGRKDGLVALGRVLTSSWSSAPERVWVDLNRSIGFAEQQSDVKVGSVWLFGPGAEAQVPAAQAVLKLPVRVSPVEYTPFYWVEQAAKLPTKDDGNLISQEQRVAPQRQRMFTATSVILLILVVLSLLGAGAIEVVRKLELKSLTEINRLTTKLQDQKNVWQKKYGDAARKAELVRVVAEEKVPPVPAWFLGYLSEAVPADVLLTQLRVSRSIDGWDVSIAGAVHTPTNQPAAVPGQSLAALSNSLVSGPFHFQITNAVGFAAEASKSKAASSGLGRASPPVLAGVLTNQFRIEGYIQ